MTTSLVGRNPEIILLTAVLATGRNALLEGPVGVGKTALALEVLKKLKRRYYRIDGDSRYSEQKLSGYFDPAIASKKGFIAKAFVPGPLVLAMKEGAVLFINELNRLPEGVQNILLPAIDEGSIQVPRLGEVVAKKGFCVIATQNPKEFVATTHLSEALLDRFEIIKLNYPSEAEELEIVTSYSATLTKDKTWLSHWPKKIVHTVRSTRADSQFKRGASIRAGLAIAELALSLEKQGKPADVAFLEACALALPTRVELETQLDDGANSDPLREWLGQEPAQKKN